MNWHEIVKYSPQKYDSNGIYTTDEWTSIWDVGKKGSPDKPGGLSI